MIYLTIILPDLFAILKPVEGAVRVPALQQLLHKANKITADYDDAMGAILATQAKEDGVVTALNHYWLRADPAAFTMTLRGAQLTAADFQLTAQEITALTQTVNDFLAEIGMTFYLFPNQRGYIQLSVPFTAETYPPWQVFDKEMAAFLPAGMDAIQWRKLFTEIQMLLHTHPVNMARQQQGKPAINGLWLWGRSDLVVQDNVIFSDKACYLRHNQDITATQQWLAQLEATIFAPNLLALKQRKIDIIRLFVDEHTAYELKRAHLWRFWR